MSKTKMETKLEQLQKLQEQIENEKKRLQVDLGKQLLKKLDLSVNEMTSEKISSLVDEIETALELFRSPASLEEKNSSTHETDESMEE
ncbi:hypothetical protein [Listeria booriae]|uniref:hypothetical protein n=1 Tax=Listeria booriae TaxID=1552123 RepID=UPI0016258048|nr:hypothetical protein [Listeria booriae]MBC2069336.1 hypothetical protein [Listeria booriae]